PAHEASAIQQLAHQVKKVERDGRAADLMVQKIRDVKRNNRIPGESRDHDVLCAIEDPGVVSPGRLAPGRQARVQAFGIRGVQELHQTRKPSRGGIERQRSAQRLIKIRLLADSERTARGSNQDAQPALEELYVERCRWEP